MAVPQMPDDVKRFCEAIAKSFVLYKEVIFAWMVAEDKSQLSAVKDDNNPLNIRYTQSNQKPWLSNSPIFREATGIKANGVVVYPDIDAGIRATIACLKLNYYLDVLATAGRSPKEQAAAIQQSPWDAGHYHLSENDPGLIIRILSDWGFVEIPKKELVAKDKSLHMDIAENAAAMTERLGILHGLEDSESEKQHLHFIAQLFRNYLVRSGYASWNEDGLQVQYVSGKDKVTI